MRGRPGPLPSRWRRPVAAAALVFTFVVSSCGPSEAEEVVHLCADLGSFGATFELLADPPADATVGQIRGALEKVAPFLGRVRDVDATDEALDGELDAVEDVYRDAFDGIGDDEPVERIEPRLGDGPVRLSAELDAAARALGCPIAP